MQESKDFLLIVIQAAEVIDAGFQQFVSSDNVGLNEGIRTRNGSVNMGLSCNIDNPVNFMLP